MKTRLMKSVTVLVLLCALAISLTGCDSLDYREAIDLYNQRQYDAAAEIFAQLGDYEDSAKLLTSSQYWAAITLAEAENYQEALPRFMKLGTYEDAAQWVTECTYQLAIAEFDAGSLADARIHFQEVPDYKQAQEYLRRITCQDFFDAVAAASTDSGSIQKEQDGKVYSITVDAAANQLILFVSCTKDAGYSFYDDLTLTLHRDSTLADFTVNSTFTMDFNESQIGSQQAASGKADISTLTPETVLIPEVFEKTVTDNQGNTTTSNDPSDSKMADTMAVDLRDLLTVIPQMLLDAGVGLTLPDIGFSAM